MEETFDWKFPIRINILVLKIVGLWPEESTSCKSTLYTAYSTINIFFIFPDLEAIAGTFFVTFSDLLTAVKTYSVYKNMETIKRLMKAINRKTFQPRNFTHRNVIEESLNFWKKVCLLLAIMSAGAVFFWSTYPILDGSIKEGRLPFLAWYPFNVKNSPLYEIIYIHQIISVAYIASTALSTDMFIAALNVFIGAQCDILCDNLRHLGGGSADVRDEFIKCIEHHKEIIKFASETNKFFNWIVLWQFFTSATSIGITMFQLTIVTPFTSEFYSLVSFGIAIVVEIFMYCWFGNEVEIKSSAIPYAAFESDWTEASVGMKKDMIVFVLRTKKPLKLSALNLFYLSLETFVKILRTAWSYFALLHQVNS